MTLYTARYGMGRTSPILSCINLHHIGFCYHQILQPSSPLKSELFLSSQHMSLAWGFCFFGNHILRLKMFMHGQIGIYLTNPTDRPWTLVLKVTWVHLFGDHAFMFDHGRVFSRSICGEHVLPA